jgi:hypothetical protein
MKQIAAVQLLGNAAALYLGYYWLSIGEARIGLLAWSLCIALLTAVFFLWMHGAGLVYGRDPHGAPFRAALRHLPALLAAAILVLLLYVALAKLQEKCGEPEFGLASWLTLKLRKPVKPAAVMRTANTVFWLLRWIVTPMLLMPWVRAVATRGWLGFRPSGAVGGAWMERALTPLLLLCALWLPLRLLAWHPLRSSFNLEMASFAVRTLLAYLLFAGGLLALEGMPLFTQRKSAVSP